MMPDCTDVFDDHCTSLFVDVSNLLKLFGWLLLGWCICCQNNSVSNSWIKSNLVKE